ncbi:MAG: hypothetical protein HKN20_16645 [Gemmatimonadetes bacterium]|nr:hypothetical protein [Gemmatimonadota bacterium]
MSERDDMNERDNRKGRDDALTPEELAARERVRALGARDVRADAPFRDELRAEFVSGAIANRAPLVEGDGAGAAGLADEDEAEAAIYPDGARGRHTPRKGAARKGVRTKRPVWYGLALAITAALLLYIALKPRPFIEVAEIRHVGAIVVDGIRFEAGSTIDVRGAIRPGSRVRVGEGSEFVISFGDILLFQASSGADFSVPIVSASDPTSWSGSLEDGEVRFMTGNDFPGHTIAMSTPEGIVEVRGTMVSVYRDEGATCICVHEGTAMIGADKDDMQPVSAGKRLVLPRGEAPFVDDIAPPHEKDLVEFQNEWMARYRGQ